MLIEFNSADIQAIKRQHFHPDLARVMDIEARVGRFYPRHITRLGVWVWCLVQACFREAGGFNGLETESIRYTPRPEDDHQANERAFSDSVFAVWGNKPTVA